MTTLSINELYTNAARPATAPIFTKLFEHCSQATGWCLKAFRSTAAQRKMPRLTNRYLRDIGVNQHDVTHAGNLSVFDASFHQGIGCR